MSGNPEVLKPLKTWSHLAGARRRPSEYEIVSTNLHFSTDNPECPWELDPDMQMNRWYKAYREGSPLRHPDWNAFRDPDELIYRTYNILHDGQENYVDGLLEEFAANEHDRHLRAPWTATLALAHTPGRYLLHAQQMGSAYLAQMAPASTISNCAIFQTGDSLRWLSRLAYRTRELANAHPDRGFATGERALWEGHAAWQGFRELLERMLVAWDWGEAFVALQLVAKPAIDEAFHRQLAGAARRNGDDLLAFLADAALRDSERHRRWTTALVRFALAEEANRDVLEAWVAKWVPLGERAIDAWCAVLPDSPAAADDAKRECWAFRGAMGLGA